MRPITIKTIPHEKQRYPTVGDWIVKDGALREIRVSEMGNEDYEFLVAIHELIEAYLCLKNGITEEAVSKFDIGYEEARERDERAPCGCKPTYNSEPGHDYHAPYKKFHIFAESLERDIAAMLRVNWEKYDRKVNTL